MTLNTVTVTWSQDDPVLAGLTGTISFLLSTVLTDTADGIVVHPVAQTYDIKTGTSKPLVANDNANASPGGSWYTISIEPTNGAFYSFQAYINHANGASQNLSSLVPIVAPAAMASYMPLPTGTPVAGQVPIASGSGEASAWTTLIDATASDIQPDGLQSAGSTGKAADAGHVHPNWSDLTLYEAPAGAIAEIVPRQIANAQVSGFVSGTLYVGGIPIPAGETISNISLSVDATAAAGVSHGWYCLLDSGLVLRAVTADQTSGNWGVASTEVKLPVGTPYVTTYSGLYYIGLMIAATTMPTFGGVGNVRAPIYNIAPVLSGTSNTGLTTPPSLGTAMNAIVGVGSKNFYAYVS